MSDTQNETYGAEVCIPNEEAQHIASLLRYAISLNTTAGLVSPTERRLATPTYKAAELAALVLEGKPFEEAVEEANNTWTGSLEEDHQRALELLESNREFLRQAMTGRMSPEQFVEFLEVTQEQFLELTRSGVKRPTKRDEQPLN
jgi:ABC-type glycerol-3-phosphate transport system substrate-binding protein